MPRNFENINNVIYFFRFKKIILTVIMFFEEHINTVISRLMTVPTNVEFLHCFYIWLMNIDSTNKCFIGYAC